MARLFGYASPATAITGRDSEHSVDKNLTAAILNLNEAICRFNRKLRPLVAHSPKIAAELDRMHQAADQHKADNPHLYNPKPN